MSTRALTRLTLARLRVFSRRHRLVYWSAAAGLALTSGAVVGGREQAAAAARDWWGPREDVLIVERAVAAGALVVDVRPVEAPAGLVPEGAVGRVPDDATARVDLVAGEILIEARLADPSSGPPSDARRLAVPRTDTTPPVVVGQRVDLLSSAGATLATDATVTAVEPTQLVVAVGGEATPAVAAALAADGVTVVLR